MISDILDPSSISLKNVYENSLIHLRESNREFLFIAMTLYFVSSCNEYEILTLSSFCEPETLSTCCLSSANVSSNLLVVLWCAMCACIEPPTIHTKKSWSIDLSRLLNLSRQSFMSQAFVYFCSFCPFYRRRHLFSFSNPFIIYEDIVVGSHCLFFIHTFFGTKERALGIIQSRSSCQRAWCKKERKGCVCEQ